MAPPRSLLLTLSLVAVASTAQAQQGGVEISSGETLGKDVYRVSLSYIAEYRDTLLRGDEHVGDVDDLRFTSHTGVLGFDYGVLGDLTVSALIPVTRKELRRRSSGSGTTTLRAYGLGDVALLAKYRVLRVDWKQSSFNLSGIAGLELPTGVSNARRDGVRLPNGIQTGSSSWDPILALAISMSINRFRFDANVFYKINTRSQHDLDRGDEVTGEVDVAYRFLHVQYPGPSASAKVGVRVLHAGQAVEDGSTVTNTGYTVVVIRPGLSFHPIPRIDLSLNADVPVYQYVHGRQLSRDLRVSIAFGVRF